MKKRDPLEFKMLLDKLKASPVEMVSDLSEDVVKDIPREKIDTRQFAPIVSGEDHIKAIADKRAARQAAKQAGKSAYGLGKKLPGLGLILGGLGAASADDALANAVIPGGVDSLGEGSDSALNPSQLANVEQVRELNQDDRMNKARLLAIQSMIKGK